MPSAYLKLNEAQQAHYLQALLQDTDLMAEVYYNIQHPRTDLTGKIGRRRADRSRICPACGAPFTAKRAGRKYCSRSCASKQQRATAAAAAAA